MISVENLSLLDNQFLNDELNTEPCTAREEEDKTVLAITQDLHLNLKFPEE
jgi:hypothetical protein